MGTPGSIYEAITQRPDDNLHPNSGWPADLEERRDRVVYTRRALGFDWHYTTDCLIEDHGHVELTAYQCGRWRDPAALLIPHGPPQSLQTAVNALFFSGSAYDFSFPGPAPCPPCGETCVQLNSASLWSILPWSAINAPDRLFLASSRVDIYEDAGEPPVPSPTLMIGVEYCLVAVVYSIPNHFVTQFRSMGRWLKYDCMLGGSTTYSNDFDSDWYHGHQHMYAYLRKSMVLPVAQRPSTAYRSASYLERSDRERSERIEAVCQGPVMPPPYRSSSHGVNSSLAIPVRHGSDVSQPYRSRSHL